MCHLPFLMPVAGLLLFAVLPWPVALALYVPLTAISLAIGIPGIRALYRPIPVGGPAKYGSDAVVVSATGRTAVVRWESELWSSVADVPLAPGDRVRVVAVDHLTAIVRRTAVGEPITHTR